MGVLVKNSEKNKKKSVISLLVMMFSKIPDISFLRPRDIIFNIFLIMSSNSSQFTFWITEIHKSLLHQIKSLTELRLIYEFSLIYAHRQQVSHQRFVLRRLVLGQRVVHIKAIELDVFEMKRSIDEYSVNK